MIGQYYIDLNRAKDHPDYDLLELYADLNVPYTYGMDFNGNTIIIIKDGPEFILPNAAVRPKNKALDNLFEKYRRLPRKRTTIQPLIIEDYYE